MANAEELTAAPANADIPWAEPVNGPPEFVPITGAELAAMRAKAMARRRLTVADSVVWQPMDGNPVAHEWPPYSRWIEGDDEPYQRTYTVGSEWTPLDLGWLAGKDVGMLCLRNVGPRPPAGEMGLVVEVGVPIDATPILQPFARVRPGADCRFEPHNGGDMFVCCPAGKARLTVFAVPA